jgi:hypothetical protein
MRYSQRPKKQGEYRAYNSKECVVCGVRGQAKLMISEDNIDQSHENTPTDEMTHFNEMTI